MPFHISTIEGKVEVLEKMWEFAKKLHLNPEGIRNVVLLSKSV
jgi:hypothetical protein